MKVNGLPEAGDCWNSNRLVNRVMLSHVISLTAKPCWLIEFVSEMSITVCVVERVYCVRLWMWLNYV